MGKTGKELDQELAKKYNEGFERGSVFGFSLGIIACVIIFIIGYFLL